MKGGFNMNRTDGCAQYFFPDTIHYNRFQICITYKDCSVLH